MENEGLSKVSEVLAPVANVLDVAGQHFDGVAGTVFKVLGVAARFAADLAKQGVDPITHIERLHAAEPALKNVKSEWKQKLDELYGETK